ncbi:MAG: MMPL family transporter [Planctomycetia bacterium]|nr:MMPL family transporter [Planctomycetia bacterium]
MPIENRKKNSISSQAFSQDEFLNRSWRWFILILFIFLFGIFLYGGLEARKTRNNRVADWFPEEFPETQKLSFFRTHFGSNEMVLISWDGLEPEDPIQERLAETYMQSPGKDEDGNLLPPLVRRTLTTKEMLAQLEEQNKRRFSRQEPPKPIRELSMENLSGWLLSRDHKQGCILVMASQAGAADRAQLLKKLYDDTMRLTGLTHTQIHLAGTSCDSVAIDDATNTSQRTLFPIFGVVCSILLAVCLKNPILSVTVFIMALMNQEVGPAAIFFTGSHMDSISLLVSALTFVLTMECGIHLANYYRDSVLEGGTRGAVLRTIQKGIVPCSLATITTVLGMGSLAISLVTPICNFGIYTSISLSLGTILLFLFIASYWENWPPYEYILPGWRRKVDPLAKLKEKREEEQKIQFGNHFIENQNGNGDENRDGGCGGNCGRTGNGIGNGKLGKIPPIPRNRWFYLAGVISRVHWLVILGGVALLAVFSTMVSRLETNITLHGMLRSSNEVIVDYDYLEEHFGGLVPIEVVLRIPKNDINQKRSRLETLELIHILQEELNQVSGVDGSVSILNVLPERPALTERSGASISARRVYNRQITENTDQLVDSQFFCMAAEEEMWRISMRVRAGADLKYEPLLEKLELTVYETLLKNGITYAISDAQVQVSPFLADAQKKAGEKGLPLKFRTKNERNVENGKNMENGRKTENLQAGTDSKMNLESGISGTLSRTEKRRLAREKAEAEMLKFRDVSIVVTGAIPLVFKAQQQLLKDLIDSFLMAFVLISVTLIVLQRSIIAGLVIMLPNILPSVMVFGILALLQIKIDIGSMMTASVALGITVDGTLHFLTWFKNGIRLGYSRKDAVIYAYSNCADAMLQTAFICSFTFLVFSVSGFVPVARFAWMLCVLLSVAVCADLLLTPALLISPLGWFFVRKVRRK